MGNTIIPFSEPVKAKLNSNVKWVALKPHLFVIIPPLENDRNVAKSRSEMEFFLIRPGIFLFKYNLLIKDF